MSRSWDPYTDTRCFTLDTQSEISRPFGHPLQGGWPEVLSMRGDLSKSGGVRLTSGARRHQRDAVKAELQKLLKALRKRGALVGKPLLIGARVPIIKCALAVLGGRIPADISLGVANGLSAVALVEQQVALLKRAAGHHYGQCL